MFCEATTCSLAVKRANRRRQISHHQTVEFVEETFWMLQNSILKSIKYSLIVEASESKNVEADYRSVVFSHCNRISDTRYCWALVCDLTLFFPHPHCHVQRTTHTCSASLCQLLEFFKEEQKLNRSKKGITKLHHVCAMRTNFG
jgi:hypothetical protein